MDPTKVLARKEARDKADELFAFLTSEIGGFEGTFADESRAAFVDQFRKLWDEAHPSPPTVDEKLKVQVGDQGVDRDIEESECYRCRIDGTCARENETGSAVLIRSGRGVSFWIPTVVLDTCPGVGDDVGMLYLPGWKILEDGLEFMIED